MKRNLFFKQLTTLFFMVVCSMAASAQDDIPFKSELDEFKAMDERQFPVEGQVVFTGSSSIHFWKSLHTDFPHINIIQRGFGGSQFSDLLRNIEALILQYKPLKVFIYEGDNDIGEGKSPALIYNQASEVVDIIKARLPETDIYFISPKPSLSRASKKCEYLTLNQLLQKLAAKDPKVTFINVWPAMLDGEGNVLDDIFVDDGLHLNEKGYDIWQQVIGEYLK